MARSWWPGGNCAARQRTRLRCDVGVATAGGMRLSPGTAYSATFKPWALQGGGAPGPRSSPAMAPGKAIGLPRKTGKIELRG